MSQKLMYILISKMNIKLNDLIETNDYDLLCEKVQCYSKRLDRVLTLYNKSRKTQEIQTFEILSSDCSYIYEAHS